MKIRLITIAVLSIIFVLMRFSYGFAGRVVEIDSDDQFAYAENSFIKGLFLQAEAEYRRFVHFFPQDKRIPEAMYKTGLSLFHAQKYVDAITELNHVIGKLKNNPFAVKAHFVISECQVLLGNFNQALLDLQNLILISDDIAVIDEAHYRSGWIHLEARNWEESAQSFASVSELGRQRFQSEALLHELKKEKQISRKDPTLSGFLSIIPGGGFFYCEEYRNALVSFLLNGLLIYAAAESFNEDNIALGTLLTIVEFGFYAGNIYGGVNSARKYNRHEEYQFIRHLQRNLKVNLSSRNQTNHTPTFLLSLQFTF